MKEKITQTFVKKWATKLYDQIGSRATPAWDSS